MVNSGTEATMSRHPALRERSPVGTEDPEVRGLLPRALGRPVGARGVRCPDFGMPDSAGVPEAVAAQHPGRRLQHPTAMRAYLRAYGARSRRSSSSRSPRTWESSSRQPGFLESLREATRAPGALLIFDEVISGFRVARGRRTSAARHRARPHLPRQDHRWRPAGRRVRRPARRSWSMLAPLGPVYQAGTLSGNPVTMAAGHATLGAPGRGGVRDVSKPWATELAEGSARPWRARASRAACSRWRRCSRCFSASSGATRLSEVERADRDQFRRFFFGMLERGFYLPPSPFEAAFLSLAHTDDDIGEFLDAAGETLPHARLSRGPSPEQPAPGVGVLSLRQVLGGRLRVHRVHRSWSFRRQCARRLAPNGALAGARHDDRRHGDRLLSHDTDSPPLSAHAMTFRLARIQTAMLIADGTRSLASHCVSGSRAAVRHRPRRRGGVAGFRRDQESRVAMFARRPSPRPRRADGAREVSGARRRAGSCVVPARYARRRRFVRDRRDHPAAGDRHRCIVAPSPKPTDRSA